MEHEIIITVKGLLWFFGAIITIGGVTAVISRWIQPIRTMKADIASKASQADFDALKKEFGTLAKNQNSDHKELQKIEMGIEKTCKCILAITDHELTNNSVDKLKKARDEMQDYLIEK